MEGTITYIVEVWNDGGEDVPWNEKYKGRYSPEKELSDAEETFKRIIDTYNHVSIIEVNTKIEETILRVK